MEVRPRRSESRDLVFPFAVAQKVEKFSPDSIPNFLELLDDGDMDLCLVLRKAF